MPNNPQRAYLRYDSNLMEFSLEKREQKSKKVKKKIPQNLPQTSDSHRVMALVYMPQILSICKFLLQIAAKLPNNNSGDMMLQLRDYIDTVSCTVGNGVSVHSSQLCGILSTPEVSTTTYKKINTLLTNFQTPGETPVKMLKPADDETPVKSSRSEDAENIDPIVETPPPVVQKDAEVDASDSAVPVKLIRCRISSSDIEPSKGNLFTKKTKSTKTKKSSSAEEEVSKIVPPQKETTDAPSSSEVAPGSDAQKSSATVKPGAAAVKRKTAAPPAKGKAKCAKKIKLVSGQKKLSQFFKK